MEAKTIIPHPTTLEWHLKSSRATTLEWHLSTSLDHILKRFTNCASRSKVQNAAKVPMQ
jgi:hypothetical protein